MINFLKNLFKKKEEVPVVTDTSSIPSEIIWQTMLLNDDEILIFKDDEQQVHYFTLHPLDKNKHYKVLIYE